jgi:7,8-dihydroneopterin aldolase/epimerase/oxygenase
MGIISIETLRVYAYHGVHQVEQVVGQWYLIDLQLDVNCELAQNEDELTGTVDYSKVIDAVTCEMKVKSQLIEHVAQRIVKKLRAEFPLIKKGFVKITKPAPPVSASVKSVSVTIKLE